MNPVTMNASNDLTPSDHAVIHQTSPIVSAIENDHQRESTSDTAPRALVNALKALNIAFSAADP